MEVRCLPDGQINKYDNNHELDNTFMEGWLHELQLEHEKLLIHAQKPRAYQTGICMHAPSIKAGTKGGLL